ncbi:hypothetical protein AMK26_12630 [Streptomyces sp. CB03234]|nr:hypothetical protein AMK26_12630 [Streptomyces sp. CB03234]
MTRPAGEAGVRQLLDIGTGLPTAGSGAVPACAVLWLKTGGRWGCNTVIAATEDLSRTLVYSVDSTDTKGEEMNPVAEQIMRAAFAL